MTLTRIHRRCAPASLAVLLAFATSLAPHRTAMAAEPEPAEEAPVTAKAEDPPPPADAAKPATAQPVRRLELEPAKDKVPVQSKEKHKSATGPSEHRVSAPERTMPAEPMQPMSLVNGENKSGVTAQSISVPKGPGTIEGMGESFSAQASTGIATFSVPITVPAARGAVGVSLALSYSSGSGSGVAGVGWDIGVPFIARQTDRGLPSYDDKPLWHARQDRFVYNGGQELVPVQEMLPGEQLPVWAGQGWQYFRPRVEGSYLRFFWNPADRVWRVQDKTGVVLELGAVDGETDALESQPGEPSHVYRWNLKRAVDAHGNEVRYAYLHDGNRAYLSDVYDTAPAAASGTVLSQDWAHHTRLVYEPRPDVTHAFSRGWEITQSLRLARIDVTSKGEDPSAARALLRRYHVSYLVDLHTSLLTSVQVEGRCATDLFENDAGQLTSSTCPRLPAMKLGYTHVATDTQGNPDLFNGFERVDESVRSMIASPEYSVNETYTDLYDVNSDGLPDVVHTRAIPELGWKHGVWYQGDQGIKDRFTTRRAMGVVGVGGVTASSLSKSSPVVAALDLNGDATIDLVHMPQESTYSVYTPKGSGYDYDWVGRPLSTADGLDARIDLSNDADLLRVFDINGDGLVDVMKTGSSYQVWYALGRYPGGDGLFGSAQWNGPSSAQLSMAPVLRCVPWSSGSVVFGSSDVKLADMNGDGLTDIVRVRSSDIRYWPGRGDGTFGTGPLGCAGDTQSENSYVLMAESPDYSAPSASMVQLNDVNGDGTSDLVQIRTDEVDVWFNVDGTSWQQRRIITGTPDSSNYGKRVRLTDMNGSGTADIVWAVGLGYKYIDLSAGRRPWLLNRVENGLGKTTEVEYTTTATAMLEAERAGRPWTSKTPTVQHMVSQVTVRDNLVAVGRLEGTYVTQYTYRDPVYDGLQREFRGFRSTEVKTLGDTNSPTSVSASWFDLGERPTTFPLDTPTIDYTDPKNGWRDNPREALKGLPVRRETYSLKANGEPGVYLSSAATSYRLRKLYDGLDGRAVFVAFAEQTDSLLYDTAAFTPSSGELQVPGVQIQERAGGALHPQGATLPMRAASRHLRTRSVVDDFGNRTDQIAEGEVGATGPIDDIIVTHTEPALVPTPQQWDGEGNWSFRTTSQWVQEGDDASTRRAESRTFYNAIGDPILTEALLSGSVELQRPVTGAPRPAHQSTPGWKVTSRTEYDGFGNAIFTAGPNGQCGQVGYDAAYAQLPETEAVYAGQPGFDVVIGPATYDCGTTLLTASAEYDRGLGAVTHVKDVNGAASRVEYDGFGRMTAMFGPKLDHPEEPSDTASLLVDYRLPDQTLRPVSMLVSRTLDGATIDDATYHEAYAYIDGLGRTIVTLSEADPDPNKDGFGWVVQGLTDYDVKGAERRKYLAWEYSEDPDTYDLSAASPAKYGQQRYDAFGRAIATYGLDGQLTLQTRYHALSADAWDGEDIGPGPHAGTYASEEKDGHGRVLRTTERVRLGGGVEPRHVEMVYEITGEPLRITRRAGSQEVIREVFYDSLGQLVKNQMPETGTWRYAYDDSGQLVGTEDPRGCGSNYTYDTAGRLLSEDYSPCEPHHAVYSTSPEVLYEYDDPAFDRFEAFTAPAGEEQNCQALNFTRGRLVAVTDRAQRSLTCYDGRGRTIEVAKQLAQPGGVIDGRWYNRRAAYDGADRPTVETTGVGTSVTTTYTRRGTVDQVTSSYGLLVDHVTRDVDGLVKEIEYGDLAKTTTAFTYDDLRRLRNLTTYRASLDGWSAATGTQQMLLQDEEFTYDRVGNPVEIRDWRDPDEWPAGAKPVTRKLRYDSLYRLSRVDYQYSSGADDWKDPYAAEVLDNQRPQPAPRAKFAQSERVQWQTYEYDWLGNTAQTHDDLDAFYDRSLGTVTNQGYQLKSAESQVGARHGSLDTQYDTAGNLEVMNVSRGGECTVAGGCADQRFEYEWDEVGRLVRARRFDEQNLRATLSFTYDASDQRVRKTSGSKHTLYIFGSLELRYADHDGTDYVQDENTEVPYLFAHGVRLARVVTRDGSTHVFLELGDHLGSTSVVLDRATGEMVERSTAYAYGEVESSLRPDKFGKFREDYRFTGKEDDVEVGLIYFGKRFYAPLLQRWISPDPLAIHAPGEADLNLYAYVHGKVLIAVDPVGLAEGDQHQSAPPPGKTWKNPPLSALGQGPTLVPESSVGGGRASPKPAPTPTAPKSTGSGSPGSSTMANVVGGAGLLGGEFPDSVRTDGSGSDKGIPGGLCDSCEGSRALQGVYVGSVLLDLIPVGKAAKKALSRVLGSELGQKLAEKAGRAFSLLSRSQRMLPQSTISGRIQTALRSADPAVRLEGAVGDALQDRAVSFQRTVLDGQGRRIGEIDTETVGSIIETTMGDGQGKMKQLRKLVNNRAMNPTQKPVFLFAPNIATARAREAEKLGVTVVRDLDTLKRVAQ